MERIKVPTERFPYSRYEFNPALFEDFVAEDARGQAMFMQDAVSDMCDEEDNPKRWFFSGFHDILGHLVEMTEEEGMGSRDLQLKEREKRKQILAGAFCAMNTLMEMTKEGDFKKVPR